MPSLLDRYDEMQRRPLGTNTALYRDPSTESMGRDYRRQQSDFNMARRLLRREARRGDTGAAKDLIGLGDEAANRGVEFGGVQRADQRADAIGRFTQGRKREILDLEAKQNVDRGVLGNPATPMLDAPVAPSLETGAQTPRLDAAMDPAAEGESFAQTEARKKKTIRTQDSFSRAESGAMASRNWWDR